MAKNKRCKFANNTCDGIDGNSGFICRDCAEDAEREEEAKRNREGHPACELIEPPTYSREEPDGR